MRNWSLRVEIVDAVVVDIGLVCTKKEGVDRGGSELFCVIACMWHLLSVCKAVLVAFALHFPFPLL